MNMVRTTATIAVLCLSTPIFAAQAPDRGAALFTDKGCVACHGEDGRHTIEAFPNLAGQNSAYLLRQMNDIAEGIRVAAPDASGQPRTEIMRPVINPVSADERTALAEWLSHVPPAPAEAGAPATIDQGAELFVDRGCNGCHGPDGLKPLADYPIIGGQKKEYIALQVKDIRDDVRHSRGARLMISFARNLTDAQIEQIADYLSRVQRPLPKR